MLSTVFEQMGLPTEHLRPPTSFDVDEVKINPSLSMIANNRENLLHGFRASGMSPALANAMLKAAGPVAALHPGSREEALAEL